MWYITIYIKLKTNRICKIMELQIIKIILNKIKYKPLLWKWSQLN